MIGWREGRVLAVGRTWAGAREVDVLLDSGEPRRALAYSGLVGDPEPGDRVLLNTSAQDLGLGTGGYAFVVALPDRPPNPVHGSGHMVKARYTPTQAIVTSVDEQDSPHHELLRDADDLDGMPVVTADLHSALPAVCAGIRATRPQARIAYVMTDGGALPAWFSRTVAGLRQEGWLITTVTTGQAFGGDLEAVTLHTGLLAAKLVAGADVAIVTQGPGNLGTGTHWGFSGVASGDAVNAVAALGGRCVGAVRVSSADQRERHRGVSHHSLTAYGRVALASADLVLPDSPGPFWAECAEALTPLLQRHRLVRIDVDDLHESLAASPVPLSTMGRALDEDHEYFIASAAAGRHAARLLA